MLLGQYEGVCGEKARMAFPKKFREVLGEQLIVTQGFEKTLLVVSQEGWRSLLEGTENKPFTSMGARETQRFLLGGATFIELDDKGRFILPEYLRKYADIQEEIVFVGMNKFVEIWNKKRWEAYNAELANNIGFIAERLSQNELYGQKRDGFGEKQD